MRLPANRPEVTQQNPGLKPDAAWLECRMMADRHDMQRSQQLGWAAGSFGTAVMLGVLTSSDRTHSRWGRRRPYLLAGAICCPLALSLLFVVPDFQSEAMMAGYITVILLLYATAFALFNVPYFAMPAEMTTHPDERTLIMSQRIFFSTLGVLMIVGLALGMTGFISGRDTGMPDQPESALLAIRLCVSIVPCLLALMAAYLMRFYSLEVSAQNPVRE